MQKKTFMLTSTHQFLISKHLLTFKLETKLFIRFTHRVLTPYEVHMEELNLQDDQSKEEKGFVKEGRAEVSRSKTVFYNPVQAFNRDLSVLVVDTYLQHKLWTKAKQTRDDRLKKRPFQILDALSASGLRSIRYAKELQDINIVDEIVANDLSEKAIDLIKKNIEHNQVSDKVKANLEDASSLLYRCRQYEDKFMIIDLDPFGSPSPFLDGAVQAIADGGLLMVTCTDMAILCGNNAETCYAKYGAMSLRSDACHEMALRIILRSIEAAANRYGRHIVPLLSVSVDFYIRIFVQVFTSPLQAKMGASKSSLMYLCTGCQSYELQNMGRAIPREGMPCKFSPAVGPPVDRKCQHCGHTQHLGGPMWSARIHDFDFVELLKCRLVERESEDIFQTFKRLKGILYVIGEELEDIPLYHISSNLAKVIQTPTPPSAVLRSAILNAGYKVSSSHAAVNSIKTNAPQSVLWDIYREWNNKLDIDRKDFKPTNAATAILGNKTETTVNFELHPGAEPLSKELELLRYQPNPLPFWGPGRLPGREDKRVVNQNKRKTVLPANEENNDETIKKAKDENQVVTETT